MIPHIFITRHGRCVHNHKEAEYLWHHYNNDDIMGLTLEGIAETERKAKEFARVLMRSSDIVFVHTDSVRSYQTASLLRSELKSRHQFQSVHLEPTKLFNELPRPTPDVPLPKSFNFHDFKEDPNYEILGESFYSRSQVYLRALLDDTLVSTICEGSPDATYVLVGHHYSLSALIQALVFANLPIGVTDMKILDAVLMNSLKFYLEHDDFLYISHLISCKNPSVTLGGMDALEEYASNKLEHAIARPAGTCLV